jgi:hypothetical protein
VQPLPSDPVVEYLAGAAAGRTSREISEATRMPLRRVQRQLRQLRDAQLVSKSGRCYSVVSSAPQQPHPFARKPSSVAAGAGERPPESVRRPRSLAQLTQSLFADIDFSGSNQPF